MASIQNFLITGFIRYTAKKKNLETDTIETTRRRLNKLTRMAAMPRGVKYEKADWDGVPAEWATPKNLKNPGLAIATLVKLRDDKAPQPAAGVAMSPWLDLLCSGESGVRLAKQDPMLTTASGRKYAKLYGTENDLKDPHISPLYTDPKGLPPILIQVSNSEILLDDTTRFETKAKAAGVNIEVEYWDKMVHVWQAYGLYLPEAAKALKKMGDYIEKKTK